MNEDQVRPDSGEQLALFRAEVVGGLVRRELAHGELLAELRALSTARFRPPAATQTRTYSIPTLERWLRAYRMGGLNALRRQRRRDRGRAQGLTPEHRQLLLDIRQEHPSASVPLILRTLVTAGVFVQGAISPQTVRRLYREAALLRRPRAGESAELEEVRQRLRWRSPRVCSLWHGDVCHALRLQTNSDGPRQAVLVHALIDDHSRYIVRLEVRETEREIDMLEILANAVREHSAPDRLYLDNGATYSGALLPVVCERLGIHLMHARPYDAPARGKCERLWRTMREQCIDHLHGVRSLHDVFVRVLAWREQYHQTPHSGLMGRTPEQVWREGTQSLEHQQRERITEEQLREAYVMRLERRVRKDSTLSVDGKTYELDAAWLAGKKVTLVRSWLCPNEPHVELEGHRFALSVCDPLRNATRRRRPPKERIIKTPKTDFRPADIALDAMLGRGNGTKGTAHA